MMSEHDSELWLLIDGQPHGPYTIEQVRSYIAQPGVGEVKVAVAGGTWVSAGRISELRDAWNAGRARGVYAALPPPGDQRLPAGPPSAEMSSAFPAWDALDASSSPVATPQTPPSTPVQPIPPITSATSRAPGPPFVSDREIQITVAGILNIILAVGCVLVGVLEFAAADDLRRWLAATDPAVVQQMRAAGDVWRAPGELVLSGLWNTGIAIVWLLAGVGVLRRHPTGFKSACWLNIINLGLAILYAFADDYLFLYASPVMGASLYLLWRNADAFGGSRGTDSDVLLGLRLLWARRRKSGR